MNSFTPQEDYLSKVKEAEGILGVELSVRKQFKLIVPINCPELFAKFIKIFLAAEFQMLYHKYMKKQA